ncbi:MAG: hypothetical protein J4N90_09850 [Chloroflexi bacterium]|nr:hypothetical protein [Chloroflexota bacterium]MCI0798088.1 hypothetical protein [Chloroflexota bacterium]MCI0825042.1 hypothetical protein [Chloroflexota bacterium]
MDELQIEDEPPPGWGVDDSAGRWWKYVQDLRDQLDAQEPEDGLRSVT